MRKVELRMNELLKYETIKELVDHKGNKNRAAQKLDISRRQVDRLIIIYKEKGKSGFVHGNRGHKPPKTLDKSISENIILLYRNKYYDFNFNHFKKFLETKENIFVSYKFIYNNFKFISKVFTALNCDGTVRPIAFPKVDWTRSWTVEEILADYGYTEDEIKTVMADLDNFKGMDD